MSLNPELEKQRGEQIAAKRARAESYPRYAISCGVMVRLEKGESFVEGTEVAFFRSEEAGREFARWIEKQLYD